MTYLDAICKMIDEDCMVSRSAWRKDDIISRNGKDEVWTPKCIFSNIDAEAVIQVGESVMPYSPSDEDKAATDWNMI
jgi:hypothetical protein